jgi:flagellar biosynthesis/type III secretory pathway M-ring protein FliF/YscJ
MEFLKSQVARLGAQLNGLNASQKMLAGALVVIMVMTLLYGARFAGNAEMQPLLDQSFSQEDVAKITGELDSRGISYTVVGDKINIPTDRKWQVMAILGYQQMLPSNTAEGFDQMVKRMSPWDSNAVTATKFNEYRAASLAQIIRQFPGVRDAAVMVDQNVRRRIGESTTPSATVHITTKSPSSRPNKQLVESASAVVAGAHAGMSRANVIVLVDGVTGRIDEPGDEGGALGSIGGSDILEAIANSERFYTQKIARQLEFLPEAKVSVTVEVNTDTTRETTQEFDAKKTFTKPLEEDSRTEESNSVAPSVAEPGAVPNTGMSLAGAGSGGTSTSSNEEKTKHAQYPTVRNASTVKRAGKPTPVAASVRVPQSYFVNIWMRKNPGGKEPSDDVIAAMAAAEFQRIRRDVMACTNLKDPETVSVEIYADALPILAGDGTDGAASAGSGSLAMGVSGYAKEIAIGVLALVSLFMVTGLVKRSTPATVTLGPIEPEGPSPFAASEIVVGEAASSDQMLDGVELDDESIRAQQMLDQVTNMVKENPEGAASLVKRWMNRN